MIQPSLIQTSIHFGKSKAYFSSMKTLNREKFDLIFSLKENRIEAVYAYINYVAGTRSKIEEILISFDKFKDYGIELRKINIGTAKNLTSDYLRDWDLVCKVLEDADYLKISLKKIDTWKKIIEHFKKEVA